MVETEGVHAAGFIGSDFHQADHQGDAARPHRAAGRYRFDIAAFLASDDSVWVSGQTIQASGGARL
jgi:3-oxoacyl-[acyl-carrier protein] reductase